MRRSTKAPVGWEDDIQSGGGCNSCRSLSIEVVERILSSAAFPLRDWCAPRLMAPPPGWRPGRPRCITTRRRSSCGTAATSGAEPVTKSAAATAATAAAPKIEGCQY